MGLHSFLAQAAYMVDFAMRSSHLPLWLLSKPLLKGSLCGKQVSARVKQVEGVLRVNSRSGASRRPMLGCVAGRQISLCKRIPA